MTDNHSALSSNVQWPPCASLEKPELSVCQKAAPAYWLKVIVVLAFSLLTDSLSAETIHLLNGDSISGRLIEERVDIVSVETGYAGIIRIKRSEVSKIIHQKAVVSAGGFSAKGADVRKADKLHLPESSAESEPLTTLTPGADESETQKFTGNLNFSMKMEDGNSDKEEIDMDLMMAYRNRQHRGRLVASLEYDLRDGDNIKRDWHVSPTYDYFVSDKLFVSMLYSAKQEKYAGLDLRQTVGPSLGYQFFEDKPVDLMSSLGLYWVDENFVDKDDESYLGPGWSLEYKHGLLAGKLEFYHRHHTLLSSRDMDKFLWHSWTGFKVPIFGSVVGSAEFEVDYDSDPSLRAESLDTTLRFKLGYEW